MSFINNLSVFITRIHRDDANEEFISKMFYEQEIASVRRIDFIKRYDKGTGKGTGRVYYQANIYFHFWFKNQIAYNIQRRILDGTHARIVYEDPWYWILLENKKPMTEMELMINERLDALAANAKRTNRQVTRMSQQLSELETTLQTTVEHVEKLKKQEIKPNTHTKFIYFEEPAVNIVQIKSLCGAEATATKCAEQVLAEADAETEAEETATKCAEQVLAEVETVTASEWDDYYNEVDRYYNEQIEHESTFSTWNCLPKNLRERKCDGCYLLDQGLGGENQQGHLCLESSDDYEFM